MSETRLLKISFPETGAAALADLEWERAPETCRILWEALPLEGRSVHGMYSGPELFIRADHLPAAPPENLTHRALPGDVGYWRNPGGQYRASPDPAVEVVLIYGRGAAIMGPEGQPTWIHLAARIREPGAERFFETARRIRYDGPKLLRFERCLEPE